jgi:hypothetical protein
MSHLRTNHESAAAAPAGAVSQNDLFLYFFHLDENFFQTDDNNNNFEIFKTNWQALKNYKFNAKARVQILHKCATTLVKSGEVTPLKQRLLHHIKQNFSCWGEDTFFTLNPNSQDMANTLWAMAKLGVMPSEAFLKTFEQHFFSQNPDSLAMANTLWAMATLRVLPDNNYFRQYEGRFFTQNPNSRDMASTLWAMAKLGVMPSGDFLKQYEGRFFTQDPSAQAMANTLWAIAVLDVVSKGKIKQLANRFFNQMHQFKEFSPIDLSQIKQSALWFDRYFNGELMPESDSISNSENKLARIFTLTSNGSINLNDPTGHCGKLKHRVDITLPRTGQKPVWMEFDGPSHFITKSNGSAQFYDGNTILNTALLLKFAAGALVLRMPTVVGKKLLNLPDQTAIQEAQYLIARTKLLPHDKAYAVVLRDNGEDLDIVPFEPHLQAW